VITPSGPFNVPVITPSGTCEKIVLEFESGAGSKPIIPMFASKLKARQVEGMALQGHF